MNPTICPKCGFSNQAAMKFCANCGQSLFVAPPQQQQNNPEPLPTMLSYKPEIPTPAPSIAPSVSTFGNAPSAAPAKKSSKGLLFGLLGCGGLLVISFIGLIIAIPVLQSVKVLPQPLFGSKSSDSDDVNTNVSLTNSQSLEDSKPIASTKSKLLSEGEALKEIGDFKQTSLKTVSADDYFPGAVEVVQATYYSGPKFVISTNGRFSTAQEARNSFNTQISNVKAAGGQILSQQSKNDTDAASYKHKGYYFLEACTKGTCSRNNSSDPEALKRFVTSFTQKMDANR